MDSDIVLLGHFSKDKIIADGKITFKPGGAIFFCGCPIFYTLGLSTSIISNLKKEDYEQFLKKMELDGVNMFSNFTEKTTMTEIEYPDYQNNPDKRNMKVAEIAPSFKEEDIFKRINSTKIFHLALLYKGEVDLKLVKSLKKKYKRLSCDVQGFIRFVDNGKIKFLEDWKEKEEILGCMDILKVDVKESQILTKENEIKKGLIKLANFGIKEILCTSKEGVTVYDALKKEFHFAPFKIKKILGRTGRGDTTIASYIGYRLKNKSIKESTIFAAALCSLKMKEPRPFKGKIEEVLDFIKKNY